MLTDFSNLFAFQFLECQIGVHDQERVQWLLHVVVDDCVDNVVQQQQPRWIRQQRIESTTTLLIRFSPPLSSAIITNSPRHITVVVPTGQFTVSRPGLQPERPATFQAALQPPRRWSIGHTHPVIRPPKLRVITWTTVIVHLLRCALFTFGHQVCFTIQLDVTSGVSSVIRETNVELFALYCVLQVLSNKFVFLFFYTVSWAHFKKKFAAGISESQCKCCKHVNVCTGIQK